MRVVLGLLLIHALYWGLGALLLKRSSSSYRLRTASGPHWIAAYFLGLAVNTVVVFTANQFLHLQVTLTTVCLVAIACTGFASLLPRLRPPETEPPVRSPEPWEALPTIALLAITVIFVAIHGVVFWYPLETFDSFLYHLPFGRLVAAGNFPTDLGPSYNLQIEAAYPPLFYYLYGLNAFIKTPDVTFLAPKITALLVDGVICLATYRLARDRFALPRLPALTVILCLVVMLDRHPNIQSFTMGFFVLALYYLWPITEGNSSQAPRSLWIGALLLGGCCWSNYVALPIVGLFIGGLAALSLNSRWRGLEPSDSLAELSLLALGVGLMLTPFLLRNWLVAGNPLYPAMVDTLGGVGMTDWFLENRSIGAPREVVWTSFPDFFRRAYPESGLLLAAVSAMVVPRSLPNASRALVGILVGGFLIVWIAVLQLHNAPPGRYLQPMLPIAAIAVTLHLWNVAGRSWRSMLEFGFYAAAVMVLYAWPRMEPTLFIALIAAVMLVHPIAVAVSTADAGAVSDRTRRLRFLMAAPLLGALCIGFDKPLGLLARHTDLLATVVVLFSGAALLVGLIAWLKWRRRWADLNLQLRSRTVFAAAIAVALVTTVRDIHFDELNAYELDFAESLLWINSNLAADALIMTMEDRLFLLDRAFVPADDWGLESFYKAPSRRASMEILEDIGVTHVFFSGVKFEGDFLPFRAKDFLWAEEDNDYVRVIHAREDARVVELNYDSHD